MINFLEKKKYLAIILTFLMASEIFYLSSINLSGGATKGIGFAPTIYHLTVFFLLNFFLILSVHKGEEINKRYVVITILISIIYSVLGEIHQIFVPFRDPSLKDVMINNIGIFSSTLIYLYYKQNSKHKKH